LIGCKIIAIDGTKSRAHNSKKLISIKENWETLSILKSDRISSWIG
jgi:hypothetical protein